MSIRAGDRKEIISEFSDEVNSGYGNPPYNFAIGRYGLIILEGWFMEVWNQQGIINGIFILLIVVMASVLWSRIRNRQAQIMQTNPQVPDWALFFDSRQWEYFQKLVLDYFETKGIELTSVEDFGVIQTIDGRRLGLQNIAQLCSQKHQPEWPKLITDHFNATLQSLSETDEISKLSANYKDIENLLAVRLWPETLLADGQADILVYRKDVEGTISVLVYDLPSSVVNVKPEDVQKWHKSEEELFDKAISNILINYKPKISHDELAKGIQVKVLSGDNFYIASNILLLDHFPTCFGKNGTLVAIPHRQILLCYPISTVEVLKAVNQLIPLVNYLEKQGPGSITSNLYWFHDRKFENLPYKIVDKNVQFYPPDSFVNMLNALAEK